MFLEKDEIYPISDRNLAELGTGKLGKNILVLIPESSDNPEDIQFLSKVLTAAGVNLEQDCMLAKIPEAEAIAVTPFIKSKQITTVLVFGLAPKQIRLAIEVQAYQLLEFMQVRWLWADLLHVLPPDKTKKTALWNALQVLFL
ncbi:MAG: hypothetical protein R2792_04130 [Saprospiraceae bacterium]